MVLGFWAAVLLDLFSVLCLLIAARKIGPAVQAYSFLGSVLLFAACWIFSLKDSAVGGFAGAVCAAILFWRADTLSMAFLLTVWVKQKNRVVLLASAAKRKGWAKVREGKVRLVRQGKSKRWQKKSGWDCSGSERRSAVKDRRERGIGQRLGAERKKAVFGVFKRSERWFEKPLFIPPTRGQGATGPLWGVG